MNRETVETKFHHDGRHFEAALLLLDRVSSLLLPAGAESPYDYALAHPEQTYLVIMPLSKPIPNNADRSREAPGTPFEIDMHSLSKELGLAVNLVHFRSE